MAAGDHASSSDVLLGDHAIQELRLLEPPSMDMMEPIDGLPEICAKQPSGDPMTRAAMDAMGSTLAGEVLMRLMPRRER